MSLVADAGPILSFARAQRLELLRDVVSMLLIPEAVYDDMVIRGAGKPGAQEVQTSTWLRRKRIQDRSLIEQLPSKLHLGERVGKGTGRDLAGR
jgi:predicted nucleic acid-binding protein